MKVKLTDLEPQFMRYETREEDGKPREFIIPVPSMAEAQGLWFACPKCFSDKGNTLVGVHQCEVSFRDRNVQPHQGTHNAKGEPVRWAVSGKGLEDLTTQPSILLEGGCGWHGYLTNGLLT